MTFTPADHVFALCAYGESPYLEECLQSLESQEVKTRIILATSTPSAYLEKITEKHGVPLYVNPEKKGIGADWNYALKMAGGKLTTIAHQDDLYEPGYTERMLADMNQAKDPILWFCDYAELRNGETVTDNRNLKIKQIMLMPLRARALQGSRFIRRRILSLGSPIGCPAVTYVQEKVGENPFSTEMKVSLDWDQWERLSRKRGDFVYCRNCLMSHRIHGDSATTALIADNARNREDLEMFQRFWPEGIARFLAGRYAKSEDSNELTDSK